MTTYLPHVLVVNDDAALRASLTSYLVSNDLRVTSSSSVHELFQALDDTNVDLVMLDLRLEGREGLQLAREIRSAHAIPLIFVTNKCEEADRVMGLEIAADDYITTPFSNRELLARIRSVLRRYQATFSDPVSQKGNSRRAYHFAGWELNLMTRRLVAPEGHRVELSNGEFNLLLAMCKSPERVLTRDQLLELSRLHGAEVYVRSVDVQVLRLRRKIEDDPSAPRFILTERGAGYLFNAKVSAMS